MRAARVHHAARRRGGGVAAGGAGAAARADAARRRTHARVRGRCGISGPDRGFPAGAAEAGWTVGRNMRIDTRWRTGNACACAGGRTGRARPDVILAGNSPHVPALLAGDPHGAYRVRQGRRSGRRRLRREPGAAGRQRHRLYSIRIRLGREMAGAAQRGRARRDARGGPAGCSPLPGSASGPSSPRRVARAWSEPDRPARRWRNRTRRDGFRGRPNGGLVVVASASSLIHRELIIMLRPHQLPASTLSFFVTGGGLMSYGPDLSTSTGARPSMSIASSRARSLPTCRCRRRPSSNW